MQQRFPGLGFAFCASLAFLLSGCGASVQAGAQAAAGVPAPETAAAESDMASESSAPGMAPPPPSPASATAFRELNKSTEGAMASLAANDAPAAAPAPSAPRAAQTQVSAGAIAPSREMLDIQANVDMQVQNVKETVRALHQLSARVGGVVTAERVDTASTHGTATLTLRVPSAAATAVFEDLEKLGKVLNQTVNARDIGKEYFDAGLRLSSLEATLRRYEDILNKATKVEEMLRIEQELARLRAEIEQVKGNLRWLSDRAARATLTITLREKVPEIVHTPEEAKPKFFPGARAPLLFDFGVSQDNTYAGGGASIRVLRSLSIDLDVLKRFESEKRGPDAITASIGGEIYSNLLGGGERRFLNPYLGWRAGYARFDQDDQALAGVTLGVELFKTKWLILDLEARNYFAFGGDRGGHYVLVPALAAGVAF
jgi:hypothetical protein